MTTQPYAPSGYPTSTPDAVQEKLVKASKHVKTVFDVFAVLILIATALIVFGLLVGAAVEHNSYINDYDNYYDDTWSYIVAAILVPVYGAFMWACVKFYSVVAGYIHWRAE